MLSMIFGEARNIYGESMKISNKTKESLFDKANETWDAGDTKTAFQMFLSAAQAGETYAFNSVGYFYDHGIGVKQNRDAAFSWYKRAARCGDIAGFSNIALCYRDVGNTRQAKFWFGKAYARGDGSAALELGKLYATKFERSSRAKAIRYIREALGAKFISPAEKEEAAELLQLLQEL